MSGPTAPPRVLSRRAGRPARGRAPAPLAAPSSRSSPRSARCRRWRFVARRPGRCSCCAAALLAWRVGAASPRRAALLGFAFGTAWLGAGTWWMFVSLHRYGGLPASLAALAGARCCARSSSLYLAAAMALVRALAARARPAATRCCSPPAGCSPSWRAACIFTGFPWIASGYAHVDGPLAGFAPWIGVYGIGRRRRRLAARCAGARATAARPRRPRAAGSRRWSLLLAAARCSARVASRRRRGTLARHAAAGQRAAGREVRARAPAGRRSPGRASAAARRRAASSSSRPRRSSRCCPRSSTRRTGEPLRAALSRAGAQAALLGMPLGNAERRLHELGGCGISAERVRAAEGRTTATTSTTWCRSANSCRPAFTGSRG